MQVTEVIRRMRQGTWLLSLLVAWVGPVSLRPALAGDTPVPPKPAETLYLQLRSVGLDKSRVYQVREGSLDRAGVHLTLEDGAIAFTEDVYGRITGAFFAGEGEVLLAPPDKVERASLGLFTGAAVLEEKFSTAYLRFNDDTFAELQPALRPSESAAEFAAQWNATARNLAEFDALRLLLSFSRLLPVSGEAWAAEPSRGGRAATADRMLHVRLQGTKLGNFDVFYDSTAPEQISAGQVRTVEGVSYYDVWTSFSPPSAGAPTGSVEAEVTLPRYKIRTRVKPPTELNAEAILQLEVRQGGQRALLFELSRFLRIQEVEVNGRPVEFIHNQALEGTDLARRGNDLVAVVFPQELRTGEKLELRFVYGGEVLSEAGGGLLYVGARGTWYPNRGVAMSQFDLEFRYPAGWTLVATGKRAPVVAPPNPPAQAGSGQTAADEQLTEWVSERPIPMAGFNLGKYARAAARAGAVTVESYAAAGMEHNFPKAKAEIVGLPEVPMPTAKPREPLIVVVPPPPSPVRNAQPVADRSARAVEFFAHRFGPFPYSSLAMTQMPGLLSQGWPGLVFLSSFSFLTPEERRQLHQDSLDSILSNQVLVHETAHQWWGDLVTWKGYRDQWMVEGLANYCALMMLETENPGQFRAVLERYRDELLQKNKDDVPLKEAGPVTLGGRLSSSRFPNGYEAISYGRGTWLFHMLRHMLRDAEGKSRARSGGTPRETGEDEPFVRGLRKVRERSAGKVITTRELLQVFAADLPPSLWYEGRPSLDWFLDSWVNGTALPQFELRNVKFAQKDSSTVVSGTLLQKNVPPDLVTSVPLYAPIAGKAPVFLGRVFADGAETPFHLTAPAGTRKIVVDPYQTVLSAGR